MDNHVSSCGFGNWYLAWQKMTDIEKAKLKIKELENKIQLLKETIDNFSVTKNVLEQYVMYEENKTTTEIPDYGNRSNTEEIQ